ncbi:hypothetical protein BH09PAT2_BH09PAT2_05390 [soil metagenome]
MKSNKVLIAILIVILFFIIFHNRRGKTEPERKTEISTQSVSTSANNPKEWQVYKDETLQLSLSFPANFKVMKYSANSIIVVKNVANARQSPSNFIYFSVINKADDNNQRRIYNYNKNHLDSLLSMKINDEKPLAGESAGLDPYITYSRLPDTTISGNTAKIYMNLKPLDFPAGTKEYRYIVDQPTMIYLIGGYIAAPTTDVYSIEEKLYQQIISTIWLPTPKTTEK